MKPTKPIDTKRMFVIPMVFLLFITVTFGFITFYFTLNRFKQTMIDAGSHLAETLSLSITSSQQHKADYIAALDTTLISAGQYVLKNRDQISNDYLKGLTEAFIVSEIYWYSPDGEILYDANDTYVGWTPIPEDPIDRFMKSGLNLYIEDIRKFTEDDRYFKFVYIRDTDGYFVQVGLNATEIQTLIARFDFQYIVEQFVNDNPELLYALIIDQNYISVADSDIADIGINYSGDSAYEKALYGITIGSDWYYDRVGEVILEVSTPIYYHDEVIGVLGIGYSYDSYYTIRTFLLASFIILITAILLLYTVIQYSRIIKPLRKFSKQIEAVNVDSITSIQTNESQGVLSGLNHIFTQLLRKVYDKEHENLAIIDKMTSLAFTDQLTQLPNRNAGVQILKDLCVDDQTVAVIYLDVDNFKTVNDTRGHDFGDLLIQEIAKRLKQISVSNIHVFRQQGDEFLIVYAYPELDKLVALIDYIKSQFTTAVTIEDTAIFVEFSMGIATYPKDGRTPATLLHKADVAMYEAKKRDKMSHMFYDDQMHANLNRKNEVLALLNDAILNDWFYMVYQPQINIDNNEIVGLEALLRIQDSKVSPSEFITVAEQNRLINKIGRIVIDKVLQQQKQWIEAKLSPVPVFVNLSAIQLQDPAIIDFIRMSLEKYEVPAELFGIEVTESAIIDSREQAIQTLKLMKEMGIKTAIDDFGSGQAGINYMTNFKVDIVKFDKSFSDRYLNEQNINIYLTILKLTSEFGFITLAEGIETKAQVDLLQQTNCKLVQGYYYHKPALPTIITDLLQKATK
ncbi:EAL domain-containing protein [Methanobacterium sp. YSL]|nr:EAL domain-containing protein [Methanobacterium sp. YSL]